VRSSERMEALCILRRSDCRAAFLALFVLAICESLLPRPKGRGMEKKGRDCTGEGRQRQGG
jgi:hypothetical protein